MRKKTTQSADFKPDRKDQSYNSFSYSSKTPLLVMTWKHWFALAVGVIALVVLVVSLVKLCNYERKLHSQIKTYQDGRL